MHGNMGNAHAILAGKSEEKTPFRRPSYALNDSTEVNIKTKRM
jgi:hypothetical protein